ncbi:hypothetical protein NKJ23_00550 [Mesorhizobium sp. M0184]|uniref:hypothetical protein n=1 Tax=Mesorhizobium sp. M0184 TaxID=2956906 RepID=UPI00333C311B
MPSLAELLGETPDQKDHEDPFYARFGFTRNPFPAARTIIEEVLYNQVDARDRFVGLVREVLAEDPQRRAMGVQGGTGGGKTHFLRHCQYMMREFRRTSGRPFAVVEILAGSSSASHLVREVLREADEAAKLSGEYDLLTAIVRSCEDAAEFDDLKQGELRNVLQLLFKASRPGFVPPDRDGRMSFEPLRDLAKKWLGGAALSNTEKRHLGVFARLGSAAMMTRNMTELLSFARSKGIVFGVMLCLDEVETLFSGGYSASKIQGYLQDLRYLFDEAIRSNEGYSLLMLSASTPQGAANLRNYNYPLFQRLGFEEGSRADLAAISDALEVKGIAELYVSYERERAALKAGRFPAILSDEDFEDAYRTAATTDRSVAPTHVRRVNQGQLLQALHQIVEKKREAAG